MAEYKRAGEVVRWGDRTLEETDKGWQCKEKGYSLAIEIVAEGRIRRRLSLVVTEDVEIHNRGVLTKKLTFDRRGRVDEVEIQFTDKLGNPNSVLINAAEEMRRLGTFPFQRFITAESTTVSMDGRKEIGREKGPTFHIFSHLVHSASHPTNWEITMDIESAKGEKILDHSTNREGIMDMGGFVDMMERFLRQNGVGESINRRELRRWRL
ncbi:hypothetical protein H0N98_05405 [Candidatus Micrarchaeota archaeon]|nr:hypothetical protein [Candidatus Micrarchaeota archaeon]